jgi:hypothetical protein
MKTDIIKQYLEQYPDYEDIELAELIYKENQFNSIKHIMTFIKYYQDGRCKMEDI